MSLYVLRSYHDTTVSHLTHGVVKKSWVLSLRKPCPRNSWVGITDNPQLRELQERVEKAFEKLGFEREDREFQPL